MKKKIVAAGLGLLLALTLRDPETAMEACRQAGALWAFRVAPSLFPYMILSRLLSECIRHPAFSILLGMLGGAPAGAALLENRSDFSPRLRQALAVVCTTASPSYLLGALSAPPLVLGCHWAGAALSAGIVFFLRRSAPGASAQPSVPPQTFTPVTEILASSSGAMITVCGCMAFYAALSALLGRLFSLPPALGAALSAFLEMAGGCARIQALSLSSPLENALLCATVSFGGLSIFTQNAVYLSRAGVNLRFQFFAKLLHGLLAFVLCLLCFSFL